MTSNLTYNFPLILKSYMEKLKKKIKKGYSKIITYSIWCFCFFFHFLHSNFPDIKCHRKKWRVLFFTRIKLVARVLACARAIARIKSRGLLSGTFISRREIFYIFFTDYQCTYFKAYNRLVPCSLIYFIYDLFEAKLNYCSNFIVSF